MKTKINIEFDTSGGTFKENWKEIETWRVIDKVMQQIRNGRNEGVVNDTNGNKIGKFCKKEVRSR